MVNVSTATGRVRSFWWRALAPEERRTLIGCMAGWGLDAMDVTLYGFLIPVLMATWHMSGGQAGLIGTSALMSSALGGWVAGILADRYGRVTVLRITILWFSVFAFIGGFTNNFEQLLAVRTLQGIGFGGEWACGAVLIAEIIRPELRGRAMGYVQSGYALGWGLAAIAFTVLFSVLPESIAWRAMFWFGLAPAFLAIWIRRFIPESPRFAAARSAEADGGFALIFAPPLLGRTVLGALLALGIQGGGYSLGVWLPTFLKTVRGLSVLNTGGYLFVMIAGSFCGFIVSAHANDRFGRRRSFILFSVLSLILVAIYTMAPISNALMLPLGFPLGFCMLGIYSGMGPLLTELYPTVCRGSGSGFCYNSGRAVGAVFPAVVGYLSATMPLGQAIGMFATGSYLVVAVVALMLPETSGQDLAQALSDNLRDSAPHGTRRAGPARQ